MTNFSVFAENLVQVQGPELADARFAVVLKVKEFDKTCFYINVS